MATGSTLKLPESARISQSRVWVMVCIEPATWASASGQALTSRPSPSQRTSHGLWRKLLARSGTSLTVHRQSRSGSTTGWADENTNGSSVPNMSRLAPPHESSEPTSPSHCMETGSSSAGRPTSQVANSRSPQGSGAVLAMLGAPKGET